MERSATIGSSLPARIAGYVPKTTPTKVENPTATETINNHGIGAGPSSPETTPYASNTAAMPSTIPVPPPISERISASIKNWVVMSRPAAPIALRMPISRVRSVTETSMMFMIPIPATSSATPPIAVNP